MKTITIEIKKKSAEDFLNVLEKQKSIRIIDNSEKAKFKRRIKTNLEDGLRLVKLHQQGKVKLKSLDELINEL
jgi:hypothetical protein